MSSAPASRATSITSSSETFSASYSIVPLRWNIRETEPATPRFPPFLLKILRTSAAARFLLSVRTSTITATPPAAYPSYTSSSYAVAPSSPVPFLIARSILSLGILAARALIITVRRRGFELGSPPPIRAAIEISLMNLVKILPRFASARPFACFMVAHLLCPDIQEPLIN